MRTHSRRALLGAGIAVAGSGLLSACATGTTGSGLHSGMDGMNGAPLPRTGGRTRPAMCPPTARRSPRPSAAGRGPRTHASR